MIINDQTVFDNLGGAFSKLRESRESTFDDEFVFRKAKIIEVLGPKDDRLRVQVLGMNSMVLDEEKDFLPCYPPFFQGQSLPGDVGDIIWVICTPDLQQGYILGSAPIFSKETKYVKGVAYNYDEIKKFLSQRHALPQDFEYENLIIEKCVFTEDGGICEGYNRKTGDWFLLNSTGAIITLQQNRIYIRVGSPPNPISSGPAGFSAIEMTTDKIEFKTANFVVNAEKVVLGHHGLKVGGLMNETTPCVGENQVPVIPVPEITI